MKVKTEEFSKAIEKDLKLALESILDKPSENSAGRTADLDLEYFLTI